MRQILPTYSLPLLITAILHALLLPACSISQHTTTTPITVQEKFSVNGTENLPQKWWLSFHDTELDGLISQSLSGNLNLQGAWDRLDQARAISRQSGSYRFPHLDGTAGLSRTKIQSPGNSTSTTSYSLGLAAQYEIDLWGRVQAGFQATEQDVLAAQEDLLAASVTLSAEVASVWYRLIEQRLQLELLNEQITINEKYLDLVTYQFKSGRTAAIDVLQQQQILEAIRGEKIIAAANKKLLRHQLAVLTGHSPGDIQTPTTNDLIDLPPLPDTGLPTELIQRRPDIRKAYFRVKAADSRVAAAIADRYPRVSLVANTETTHSEISDLFDNWLATLAGNLLSPLFDGGLRKAEVERTKAVAKEALHSYGQIILTSLKEVEDALITEAQQRKLMNSLKKQLTLSQQSTNQIRERYVYGDMEFLRFLTAILNHQALQRSQIKARRELIEYRINLCRAIAGGWQMNNLQRN